MVVLAWKHSTHLVQGPAPADLSLRIVGTLRDGQVVRLSAPKCTIGSAEGCTLRLRCARVQPLDCVILRGLQGTVVRSWSAKTRLNGHRFTDALLVAGDRLRIGPIEFEMTHAQTELDQAQALLDEALGGLQASRESTANQVAQFDQTGGQRELDPAEADRQAAQTQAAQAEADRQAAQTQAAQAEMLTERASLALELQAWEVAQRGAEEERARRDSELVQRAQRLETIGIQHGEIASRLEQRAAELRQQFAELERQQAAFQAQCEASRQQPQAQPQPASPIATEPQPAPEASPSQPFAGRDRRRPAAELAQADIPDSQEVNDQESQAQQSQPNTQPVREAPTESAPQTEPALRAARGQRTSDEDHSIEQYMAALLNRMRGGSDADAVIAAEPRQTKQEEVLPTALEVKPQAAPIEPVVSPQRVVDVHMAPVEMERRPTAPSAVNLLAAMRELANTHTRIVINTHGKKQLVKMVKRALGTWATGISIAVGSLVMFGLLPPEEYVLRIGCVTGFVASSYWIFKAVIATQKLFTSNPVLETPRRVGCQQSSDNKKSS